MSNSDFEKHKIELDVLAYFLKNPDAQDTLEGIVEWWLLETYIMKQYDLVNKVLIDLVNQGLIIEIQHVDAQLHYQVNKEKMQEIKERLKDRN